MVSHLVGDVGRRVFRMLRIFDEGHQEIEARPMIRLQMRRVVLVRSTYQPSKADLEKANPPPQM